MDILKGKWHWIFILSLFSLWNESQIVWLGLWFLLILFYIHQRRKPKSWLFFILSSASILFFSHYSSFEDTHYEVNKENTFIEGEIRSNPEIHPTHITFTLNDSLTKEKILINVYDYNERYTDSFQYGASCQITGTLTTPIPARNPGAFDYQSYLQSMGIFVQMNVKETDIECTGQGWIAFPLNIKQQILTSLELRYESSSYNWIKALIFGDKSQLSAHLITDFQHWNLSHLLAISGLHVGLIILFLYLLCTRVFQMSVERTKYLLLILLPIYAILANGAPPVLRAVFMAEVLFLSSLFKWRWSLIDVISVTGIFFIILDPTLITQLSFQFSFLVTFSLILSSKILVMTPSFLWGSLYVSFISQMVLIPLQLLHFYYVSPLSLLANLLFVPYFSFIVIPITLIAVLLSWTPTLLTLPIDFFLTNIHEPFLNTLLSFANGQKFLWVIGEISLLTIGVYYALFYVFMKQLEGNRRKPALVFASLLVLLLLAEQLKPYFNPHGQVTMLDVGQGDTIVIELPKRKGIIMIDAAAEVTLPFDDETEVEENATAKRIIQPFLWSKGITKIDHLIITHADQDHAGSYPFIMEQFDVKNLYTHRDMKIDKKLSTSAQYQPLSEGMKLNIAGTSFYVLHPKQEYEYQSENNKSIVLLTRLGNQSFLFTGDIDSEIEHKLMERYPKLQVDILKVAHHGSEFSTSERFLKSTRPKHALISVGRNNIYGHPAYEAITRLQQQQINIHRTDKHGAIIYIFTANQGTFSHMYP
ncbi:DNA internalization-related competence protein ComEC/Rec2 [Salinibacillus xinjiangensis]|uniref:DNA internalization-related competence protein ComEC/Rec2 n=1 Tax=Salinibacillus xinjiangensis TaxID=1229268 RepID=UPI002B27142F|nr:DNA internalization-related competence protein ComEC/Rec2 [Salinibacillus xinjiangensis]